ncbi:MAG: type II toxin-antitoxin system RelE/ParE family toxin [Acidobacteria bacterium]|nr:type II toxin-antitoxin system RelE/ParE family toxin [Acidobacteriota bacterium]
MTKKRRSVRILRRAQDDLVEIHRYILRDRPGAADRFVDKLLDAIESLELNPARGTVPRDQRLRDLGYRVLIHGEHLVFYKVLPRQVRVYRVLHGRRRYADLL